MCRLPYSIRGSVENNHFYFKYPILEQLLSTVVLARNNYDVDQTESNEPTQSPILSKLSQYTTAANPQKWPDIIDA